MKTHFKHFANRLRASVLLCGLLATAARAAEPVEWTARPGDGPKAFARHHGSTLEFRCTFTGFGGAFAPDADLRLWYQTNGMGQAWWSVPASRSNDVLSASWPPTADPGADRISFFFGAPSNAYASAVLRMQSSPGFTPNILQPPVLRLDFDGLDVLNAPWATPADVSTALLAATNYTDAAIRDYAAGNETDPVWSAEKSSYLPKSGGAVTGETSVAGLAITASPGWPEYRILFGPNSLDGTYIYWDDQSGRFATWRTAYGGYRFAMEDDLAAMAQFATNYVNAATNALTMSTASALGSYLPLSGGMLSGDLAFSGSGAIAYTGVWGVRLYANAGAAGNRIYTNEGDTWQSERGLAWLDETTNHVHAAAVAATNYTNASISPTNPAFAAAVRNVPITGADSSDLAEIAEYGSYGTVGAAILALIAGLAALKRGKADKGELRYAKKTLRNADMVVSLRASLYPILATNGLISLTLYADDVSLGVVRDGETGEVTGAAVHTVVGGEDTLLLTFDEQGEHLASGWSVTFAQSPVLNDFTFAYLLSDRTVILLDSLDNGEHEIDVGNGDKIVYVRPPAAVDGRIRDFILDVRATNTNMSAAHSLNLELDGVGVDYLISVPNGEDFDDISEIEVAKAVSASVPSVIWVRLYFTETAFATDALPVFAIRREDVTAPAGQ